MREALVFFLLLFAVLLLEGLRRLLRLLLAL